MPKPVGMTKLGRAYVEIKSENERLRHANRALLEAAKAFVTRVDEMTCEDVDLWALCDLERSQLRAAIQAAEEGEG